jgi:flagellar protein FliO/FliZ
MRLAGVLLFEARRGGPVSLKRPLGFFRILQAIAVCLLFGHACAHSQGVSASAAASPAASVASAPVVLPRTIPFKQDSGPASGDASPSLTASALVLFSGLAGFSFWAWRKRLQASGVGKGSRWWGVTAAQKSLLVRGSTRLSPRHSVHEIEWRGRHLLIGCADQAMTLLSESAAVDSPEGTVAPGHPLSAQEKDKS